MKRKKIFIIAGLCHFFFAPSLYADTLASTNQCIKQITQHVDSTGTSLSLINCQLKDQDVAAIVNFLNKDTAVVVVDLSRNAITAAGASQLATVNHIEEYHFNNDPALGDAGISALVKDTRLQYLWAMNANITDKGAEALATLPFVTLRLANNKITSVGIKSLTSIKTLQYLSVAQNAFDQEGIAALGQDAKLFFLDVSGNNIGDNGLNILSAKSHVRALAINDDNITDKGIQYLTTNRPLQIAKLHAANNKITSVGAQDIVNTQRQSLTILDLSNNQLGDAGAKILAPLAATPGSLITFYLDGNNITDQGAAALNQPRAQYFTLSLKNNRISDNGAKSLAGISALYLFLDNNKITDTGAANFANAKIEFLSLANNKLGDDSIKNFAQNSSLRSLDLSQTNITDKAITYLFNSPKLWQLIINHDPGIHDAGATLLSTSPTIRWLDVSYDSIGENGIKALRQDKSLSYLNIKGQQTQQG